MVPEGRRVFPFMSVKDNLMMGAFTRSDKADIQHTLDSILTRFPTPQGTLFSGGWHIVGWRATDDGDWPCVDGQAQAIVTG